MIMINKFIIALVKVWYTYLFIYSFIYLFIYLFVLIHFFDLSSLFLIIITTVVRIYDFVSASVIR